MGRVLLATLLLFSGCTQVGQFSRHVSHTKKISKADEYVDSLDVYLSEQYRKQREEYFAKIKKDSETSKIKIPSISDSNSIRSLLFGSNEGCLAVNSQCLKIIDALNDIQNVFTTLLNLLDEHGASYSYEDYEYSLVSRECIALLLSHISRYFKTNINGFCLVLSGILISDKNVIFGGFNKLSLENSIATDIESEYKKLVPVLEKGVPKNLRLLFTETAKDVLILREKIRDIEGLYAKICGTIVNRNVGKVFFDNQSVVKNISKNANRFLNFLTLLEAYCQEKIKNLETF